jgi:hypothetical protein
MTLASRHIYADPREISFVCGTRQLVEHVSRERLECLLRLDGPVEVMDGDWDKPAAQRFEKSAVLRGLRERIRDGLEWPKTVYYQQRLRTMERGASQLRSEEQLLARCQKFEQLYRTIRRDGYRRQEDLAAETGYEPQNELALAADRKGRILFVDGQHRLAIARLLRLESIPVQIVLRHTRWDRFRNKILQYAESHKGKIYQRIDHPDLVDIPYHHGDDRFDMMARALEGYKAGRRLIDIGCHWGHMCHKFEDLGFECMAVESMRRHIPFIEGLRQARRKTFSVWQGSIFDYPRRKDLEVFWKGLGRRAPDVKNEKGYLWLSEFDVVLALNILHHFLKKEGDYKRMIKLLKRLNCGVLFFEAHNPDEGQMKGAYRNYEPDEFAAFVAKHARMDRVELLGEASDGRNLYQLTRRSASGSRA